MSGSISHYGNWPWEPWRFGATRARNLAKSRDPLADPIKVARPVCHMTKSCNASVENDVTNPF